MKISFALKSPKTDTLAVFVPEGGRLSGAAAQVDKKTKGAVKRAIAVAKFEGKKAQVMIVAAPPGVTYSGIAVVGLGKVAELKPADFEKMGSNLTPALNRHKAAAVEVDFDVTGMKSITPEAAAAQMAQGMLLHSYRFDKYLTKEPKDKKPTLKAAHFTLEEAGKAKKLFTPHEAVADGVFLARDLASEPPNVLYPESFAAIIKKELAPLGIEVKVLHMKDIQKLGMGALEAVGQGSAKEPKLVTMQYKGGKKGAKPVAFVGKGITFDTGGISIKPAANMDHMKWDMGGAGAVTGLMRTLAGRKAKVNAVGVVALAENMPDGAACRPGDIVKTMSGQTVEILNTDAEGRLVLCDALWYCQKKFGPEQIVDLATLTGAVIAALGHEYAAIFSNDDALTNRLIHAGKETGEELWRLPLNDAWDKGIDSPAADMKNIGLTGQAGSAAGAHFLKRYIQKGVKWAHLDIAGVAWTDKDRVSVPKGATGYGVRLLDRFVADYCEKA